MKVSNLHIQSTSEDAKLVVEFRSPNDVVLSGLSTTNDLSTSVAFCADLTEGTTDVSVSLDAGLWNATISFSVNIEVKGIEVSEPLVSWAETSITLSLE